MQLSNIPGKLVLPFANGGSKNTIPVDSQIGITAGAASLTDGFPPLTMTPVAAGGVPPSGLDMNGILYEISAIIRWANAGGGYPFDADFATDTNVNGYPKGARIMRADGLGYWFNTVENNVTDPESAGAAAAGWVPDFTTGVAAVPMASANVTLTPAQYGKPLIVITGALTTNLNLIFPSIVGQWIVINNTTGNFTITTKTAAGTGVVVGTITQVVSDGVNVYSTAGDFSESSGAGLVGFSQAETYSPGTVGKKLNQVVCPSDAPYSADDTGSVNASVKIQQVIDSGVPVVDLAGKTFLINSALNFNVAGQIFKNGTLLFNGDTSTRLANVTANDVTFDNVIFNGNEKQPRTGLIWVADNVKRPIFRGCTFKKITGKYHGTNALNQTYGLLISPYGVVNFEIEGCLFQDLIKYNDNANNIPPAQVVGLGFIGGICFMPEDMTPPVAAQPVPTAGLVAGCTFDNIQTILASGLSVADQANYNDADAIRTYGQTGGAELLRVHVSDCVFRNVSKRAFKFRAAESIAHDCEVYADGMQYGMIAPIDVTSNAKVQNVKVFASIAKPVQLGIQWSVGPDATQRETLLEGIFVSHCIVGVGFFSDPSNSPLRNLILRNIQINQASAAGILQTAPLPSTMENIAIENMQIYGNGNNCAGIELNGGIDVKCGAKIGNVYIRNGSFKVGGVNNDIHDVQIEIDSNTYAGASAAEYLFRIGANGYGGYQHVKNVFINAHNLATTYLNASRTILGLLIGDNATWKNIRVKVPDGLSQSYAHCEMFGNDWNFDGYTYDGPGYTLVGTQVAAARWSIKNAVRLGGGASISEFLYTSNAATADGLFENITDFRPTTANSITINNGVRFIVYNVSSKTSNATIVQHGGLAKTANINTF